MGWMRHCPICRKRMDKETLELPWLCMHCGWTSSPDDRKKIYQAKPAPSGTGGQDD